MAKKTRQISSRSRAARRAVSPPPELVDTASSESSGKVRVLEHIADLTVRGQYKSGDGDDDDDGPGAHITESLALGVVNAQTHKVGKSAPAGRKQKLSAKQRKRQMDAALKAESLKDVLSVKVAQSKDKLRGIKERKKDWEDFNRTVSTKGSKSKSQGDDGEAESTNPFAALFNEE
ncbi:uncharacterized protein SAPINGB_P002907 [Magnusiomyces paraingens]|uniref:Ribosome biogenesis protein Alb1 n=1 Tax=Magnusiomyces paraingens TaxID=2606893 RepID=A0A5E8BIN7_9ASCO|nr:uncharacterized protein SAPINGB_P002907 [Saprochaete ingens]VVT50869.1 unnamed protein product [Saprochaete ingens]